MAGNITSQTKAKIGTDAKFYNFPSINGSDPSVVGGGNAAVQLKDNKGAAALMTVPRLAGGGDDLGQARRVHLPEQGGRHRQLPGRHVQADRRGAGGRRRRSASTCPIRRRARSAAPPGAGEWKILHGLLQQPQRHPGHRRGARGRGRVRVQGLSGPDVSTGQAAPAFLAGAAPGRPDRIRRAGGGRKLVTALIFLAPALVLLGFLVGLSGRLLAGAVAVRRERHELRRRGELRDDVHRPGDVHRRSGTTSSG